MRIEEHPILGKPEERKVIPFTYDGTPLTGYEGEPIAMALEAAGIMIHRYTKKYHKPRGVFLRNRPLYGLRYGCRRNSKCQNLHHSFRRRYDDTNPVRGYRHRRNKHESI